MRRLWGCAVVGIVAAACGGGDVSTDPIASTTTRGANVVIIDEEPPASTTAAATSSPTTSTAPPTTSTASSSQPTTTAATTADTATLTTSALVAPIGDRLIAELFGDEPPERVVLIDADVIEDHRVGSEPFATRHPLARPYAAVAGPWIHSYGDDGAAVARIDDPSESFSVPDGWMLSTIDRGPVLVASACGDGSQAEVGIRSVMLEPLGLVPIATLTDAAAECYGVYLRGSAALSIEGDAEGNSSRIVNSAGVSVIGSDYAGYLSLDPSGERFAYTDQSASANPHMGFVIVLTDVASGLELGRWALDQPVTNLQFDGPWVVGVVVDTQFRQTGLLVLDTTTGAQRYVETTVELLLPGP